jgi:hypothetical protein
MATVEQKQTASQKNLQAKGIVQMLGQADLTNDKEQTFVAISLFALKVGDEFTVAEAIGINIAVQEYMIGNEELALEIIDIRVK